MHRAAIGLGFGLVVSLGASCDKAEERDTRTPGGQGDAEVAPHASSDETEAAAVTVADALATIPERANVVIALNVARVVASPVLEHNRDLLSLGDHGQLLEAAAHCNTGLPSWSHVVLASRIDAAGEDLAVIFATGIGQRSTLSCLSEGLAQASAAKPEVVEEHGHMVVPGPSEGQRIYAVSPDVIAIVGPAWLEAFQGRLTDRREAARNHASPDASTASVRYEDIELGLDVGAAFRTTATAEMMPGRYPDLESIKGTLDLSAGLAVFVSGEFSDPDTALQAAEMFRAEFNTVKGILIETPEVLDIPRDVLESVEIEANGTAVEVEAAAAPKEVDRLVGAVRQGFTPMGASGR